ncbi:serine/threonine-protein kinase PLK1-like [Amphibalanus amphitrite]|uniref:serine/threonine-protein kinase PLK1-like n=1 Tax=Amphibalanus amphitrite TaxID=1232801 RepID=UPI001C90C71B|nr:serine/threonine-protein kinase PLK1-like [Amphibalanus amphitrite]
MSASAKTVRITASYLPREYAVTSVVSKTESTMVKNNSLDSGVDGLRDSPNSGLRDSPNYIHDSPNQNYLREQVNLQHAPLKSASTSGMVKLQSMRNETVHAENIELPEYIVDPSTRTTYLKGKFLGKGGFARVHELTDLTNNKVYAGKIIPKSRITKPHNKEKIAREIDLHRHLRHRNVVRFEHCFEDSENVYIILEYCPRKSLVHVLKHRQTLTEPEVRYYMRQLADGAEYIHSQSIVHRDLKLGNMFLSDEMVVKVGDFGLATRIADEKKPTICGTPNYIAPEVLQKLGHGYEADTWAMGCIMYAMLVGQPPFETETLNETYKRITNNQYTLPPQLSPAASDLIARLLHPSPRMRPTTAEMLQHQFFHSGQLMTTLPVSCCTHAPKLAPPAAVRPASQVLEHIGVGEVEPPLHAMRLPSSRSEVKLVSPKSPARGAGGSSGSSGRLVRSQSVKDNSKLMEKVKEKETSLHGSIRQKISSVFRPSSDKKKAKEWTSATLYKALSECLQSVPEDADINPEPVPHSPLFITKWIDYSNKYGFGFQLSDRSVGVLFNDSTKVLYLQDKSRVDFVGRHGRSCSYEPSQVPSLLQERFTLLRYFSQYMDENLTEGGETRGTAAGAQLPPPPAPEVHMRRWVRTHKAIIMQLSNGTLQINFFKDHTKVILSAAGPSSELTVTYINSERRAASYPLVDLSGIGCSRALRDRLEYATVVLREFSDHDLKEK